jgi:hypothetical protein
MSVESFFALFTFELVQRHYTCGGVSAKPKVLGIKGYSLGMSSHLVRMH